MAPQQDTYTDPQAGICLDRLAAGYREGRASHAVTAPATAQAPCGMLTCLIGANGAGKSTLLRTVAGFMPPLGGSVAVCGRDTARLSPHGRATLMAVVLTDRPDTTCTTVEEMVALGRAPYTGFWGRLGDADRMAVRRAMQLTGIAHMAGREVSALSDGERQKVMIAKALAQDTPAILLDEPTSFLDFPSKADTMLLLRRLAHEAHKAVLVSTHDLTLALHTADRLWLLTGTAPAQDGTFGAQEGASGVQESTQGSMQESTSGHGRALSRLLGGTPRELADGGHLSRFVDRGRVVFDPVDMTIRLRHGDG